MDAIFGRYFVDIGRADAAELRSAFDTAGLVTFECSSREAFHAGVERLGVVVPHRDSDPDGVTVIEHRAELAGTSGYAAMGSSSLALHTDSSGLPTPPGGDALWCERSAGEGGEAVLVDGARVYRELCDEEPSAARALRAPDSAIFCSGASVVRSPVFHVSDSGAVRVRLRFDDLGFFPLALQPHLGALQRHAITNAIPLSLAPGQGYLIDNARFLHGRRAFTGRRRMLRLLFDVPEPHAVATGGGAGTAAGDAPR